MFGDAPAATNLDVNPNDPVARRLASGGHADFFSTEKKFDEDKGVYKDTLEVAEIRKIAPFLRMTSSEGGWRIVIADDADSMTRSAQNGILKILEEPPRNSLLILVAHRAGALIPTIRSRARFINFLPFDSTALKELIGKANPNLFHPRHRNTHSSFRRQLRQGTAIHGERGDGYACKPYTDAQRRPAANGHPCTNSPTAFPAPAATRPITPSAKSSTGPCAQTARARARGEPPPAPLQDFLKNSSLEELLKIL
jgi:hypothetical protein